MKAPERGSIPLYNAGHYWALRYNKEYFSSDRGNTVHPFVPWEKSDEEKRAYSNRYYSIWNSLNPSDKPRGENSVATTHCFHVNWKYSRNTTICTTIDVMIAIEPNTESTCYKKVDPLGLYFNKMYSDCNLANEE